MASHEVKDSCPLPLLPHEIIEEILSRLSLRPLLRLQCVCRWWRSLVSNPRFAQNHAEMLASKAKDIVWRGHRETDECLREYGVITTSRYHLKSCCVHSLYNEKLAKVSELDHQLFGREYYHIAGSCHGLICIYTNINTLFLWNPMTGSLSKLPDLGIEREQSMQPSSLGSADLTYGIGYDQKNNDYKILALFCGNRHKAMHAKLYSAKKCRWRRVHKLPPGITLEKSKPGVYANNSLIWNGTCAAANPNCHVILSYDLCSGMFKELPQHICNKGCFLLTLGELGGCLSMVCYCRRSYAEVWVMNRFGDGESWRRLVSVPGLVEFCRPLWVSNGGEILMELRSGLPVYDSEKGEFRSLMVGGLRSCLNAHIYLKALVSPNTLATGKKQTFNVTCDAI